MFGNLFKNTLFCAFEVVQALLLGWLFAVTTAWSGHCIQQRRHRLFSIAIGALNCLSIPFGTLLGVFTIMVLERASVRELYARDRPTSS